MEKVNTKQHRRFAPIHLFQINERGVRFLLQYTAGMGRNMSTPTRLENMLQQKAWLFEGESGAQYTFEIFSKKAKLPETGGIFILAYTHPRGHLAGYQVNPLSMGVTDNLQSAIATLPQQECLRDGCWNCTYILRLDEAGTRSESLKDLLKKYPVHC